jgi:hypothetical protein
MFIYPDDFLTDAINPEDGLAAGADNLIDAGSFLFLGHGDFTVAEKIER